MMNVTDFSYYTNHWRKGMLGLKTPIYFYIYVQLVSFYLLFAAQILYIRSKMCKSYAQTCTIAQKLSTFYVHWPIWPVIIYAAISI